MFRTNIKSFLNVCRWAGQIAVFWRANAQMLLKLMATATDARKLNIGGNLEDI